jgi:hypothetical protein
MRDTPMRGPRTVKLECWVLEALGIGIWEVRLAILSLVLFVLMIRHTLGPKTHYFYCKTELSRRNILADSGTDQTSKHTLVAE